VESKPNFPAARSVVVLREEFDEWAVLYNPDTAGTAAINPVGVAIWKLLDGKRSLEDIVAAIKDQFEDAPESITEDVSSFIRGLQEKGFTAPPAETT
jgi:SynChlorMet cassette protein ScmD